MERLSTQCQGSLGNVSESYLTAVQKECASSPHIHPTSRYVIARDQFYQAFPCVSTTSNTGVRRPGCEASLL